VHLDDYAMCASGSRLQGARRSRASLAGGRGHDVDQDAVWRMSMITWAAYSRRGKNSGTAEIAAKNRAAEVEGSAANDRTRPARACA
jgi:hypothetical protein